MPDSQQEFLIATKNRTFVPLDSPEQEEWQGSFTFIQAADTQLGLQERYVEKLTSPGWSKEIAWTKQMVRDINLMSPPPKFLVICGDLIDAYPYPDQEDTRKMQESDLKKELTALNIPLVCVCGNHDVGDSPTAATVHTYRASFGDDYFSFFCGGVYFLAVNSQYWEDSTQCQDLAAQHEAWLDARLAEVKAKQPLHVVVFQHIPLFISDIDEPKQYFNIQPKLRKEILDKFKKAGVKYIFCGHYHRNAGGKYGDLELVVTSAVGAQLGHDDHGYRVVRVTKEKLDHQYCSLGTTHVQK